MKDKDKHSEPSHVPQEKQATATEEAARHEEHKGLKKTLKHQPAAAEATPPAATTAETEPLKGEADAKAAELQDRFLRLAADFDNFRKRTARDREELRRQVREEIILSLLPVLDNLDLGICAAAESKVDNPFVKAYTMLADDIKAALRNFGLIPVEAMGKQFDPRVHEAVALLHSKEHPEGTLIAEVRKGYLLDGRLLRVPRVVVSKGPEVPAEKA